MSQTDSVLQVAYFEDSLESLSFLSSYSVDPTHRYIGNSSDIFGIFAVTG